MFHHTTFTSLTVTVTKHSITQGSLHITWEFRNVSVTESKTSQNLKKVKKTKNVRNSNQLLITSLKFFVHFALWCMVTKILTKLHKNWICLFSSFDNHSRWSLWMWLTLCGVRLGRDCRGPRPGILDVVHALRPVRSEVVLIEPNFTDATPMRCAVHGWCSPWVWATSQF